MGGDSDERQLPYFNLADALRRLCPPPPDHPRVANIIYHSSYAAFCVAVGGGELLDKLYVAKERDSFAGLRLTAVFVLPTEQRYIDDPRQRWYHVLAGQRTADGYADLYENYPHLDLPYSAGYRKSSQPAHTFIATDLPPAEEN